MIPNPPRPAGTPPAEGIIKVHLPRRGGWNDLSAVALAKVEVTDGVGKYGFLIVNRSNNLLLLYRGFHHRNKVTVPTFTACEKCVGCRTYESFSCR